MILNANVAPQRTARLFIEWTLIQLQVRGGATIYYSHEFGEAQNQNDGMQLNQANTNPPFVCWWKGDLWYSANANNSPLNLIILGQATDKFHP